MDYIVHFRRGLRLRGRDDDVLTAFPPAASFVEEPERLADPRRVAEEDLESAASLGALGRLRMLEQGFRIAAGVAVGVGAGVPVPTP